MNTSIGTAALHVSVAKFIGLVSAFVSSLLIAREFGSDTVTDTFFIGWTIPNTLFVILAAATPSVFIPLFSDFLVKGREREAWEFGASTARVLMVIILVLVLSGLFSSSFLIRLVAPGFPDDQIETAAYYQKILLWIVFFGSAAAILRGVLNSYRIFAVPALDGLASNVCIIASILLLTPSMGILSVVVGTLLGSIARILIQVPLLFRTGHGMGLTTVRYHASTGEFLRLVSPLLGFHFLVALYLMIGRHFASHLPGGGAISYLNYSEKLIGMPVEIIIASFSVALLPSLSEYISSQQMQEFAKHTMNVIRAALYLIMPITVAFMILREPLVGFVFERGKFTHENTLECSRVLLYYSPWIFASIGMILTQAFFAMRMTRVLFGIGLLCAALNVILCRTLIGRLAGAGVALSISITHLVFLTVLLMVFARRVREVNWSETIGATLQILLLSACMGVVLYGVDRAIRSHADSLTRLTCAGGAGLMVYLALSYVFRLKELKLLISRIKPV